MKHGTIRHPKLLALAAALELRPYEALGLLEALLDWTYDFAARGDVGRFSDAQIAQGIGYPGDPSRMICALVDAHWLDPCACARLVVHELADHAPWSWKRTLERRLIDFASPVAPAGAQPGATMAHQKRPMAVPPTPTPAPTPAPTSEVLSLTSFACAPLRSAQCAPTHEFDEFWTAYPRKCDKQRARKAWAKLRPPPLKAILDALAWQRELADWRKEDGGFVPYPATYLNGRRWEDEPPKPQLFGVTARTAGNAEAIKKGLGL